MGDCQRSAAFEKTDKAKTEREKKDETFVSIWSDTDDHISGGRTARPDPASHPSQHLRAGAYASCAVHKDSEA